MAVLIKTAAAGRLQLIKRRLSLINSMFIVQN